MESLAEKLRAMLGGNPANKMGGMTGQAAQAMQSRPYNLYLRETQALGEKPLSQQDYMLMMQKQ